MIQILIPKFPPSVKQAAEVEQMARLFLDPNGHRKVIVKVNAQMESQGIKPWIFGALQNGDIERKREALLACYWYMLGEARKGALAMIEDEANGKSLIHASEEQVAILNNEALQLGHRDRKALLDTIHFVVGRYGAPKPSNVRQMPRRNWRAEAKSRKGTRTRVAA